MTLLQAMAEEPCEKYSEYAVSQGLTCLSPDSGLAHTSEEGTALQYCPPCRLRAALAELGEEYGVMGYAGKMVNNGDYRFLQTHVRTKAGPWREIPKDQIVPVGLEGLTPVSRPSKGVEQT